MRAIEAVLKSGQVTADLKPSGQRRPPPKRLAQRGLRWRFRASLRVMRQAFICHARLSKNSGTPTSSTSKPGAPTLLFIDLHLVHEVTSPQAFDGLRERGLKVRRPDLTIATADHSIPTTDRSLPIVDPIAAKQVAQLETNCTEFGIRCLGVHSDGQGIVHVIGPELGLTQPGMTVVCGDSHTATHGAFGALAFGIGTSEVEHVLATQCLLQRQSKTFRGASGWRAARRRFGQGHHPRADRAASASAAAPAASSNTPAAPSARSPWKSA